VRAIIAYVATAISFAAMDFVWLSRMGPTLYKSALGDMILDMPRIPIAVLFYLIYIFGLVWFVVLPALSAGRWRKALINGALFGFVAYATYDLTNQATMKVWSTQVTLLDLGWGAFASAVACTVAYGVTRALKR
jgi:uncharacterized membrane protein